MLMGMWSECILYLYSCRVFGRGGGEIEGY